MTKRLTCAQYELLSYEAQYDYVPIYNRFKLTFREEYDECGECGRSDYLGWKSVLHPMGKPSHYMYRPDSTLSKSLRIFYDRMALWMASNSIVVVGSQANGKTINFTRYSRL